MNFQQSIAKYITGNLTTSDLPDIAIIGITEGLDSSSLIILAGLSKHENSFQIEDYFKKTIEELNLTLPDKRKAAIVYAIAIVDEIIEGKKDIIVGTTEIIYKAIGSYNFFSESKKFAYDSIAFGLAYGNYYSLDDLAHATVPWQKDKTNKELQVEGKKQLLDELKNWKEKMTNSHLANS